MPYAGFGLGAAIGGVIVHMVIVLSKWYHIEKAIDILKDTAASYLKLLDLMIE